MHWCTPAARSRGLDRGFPCDEHVIRKVSGSGDSRRCLAGDAVEDCLGRRHVASFWESTVVILRSGTLEIRRIEAPRLVAMREDAEPIQIVEWGRCWSRGRLGPRRVVVSRRQRPAARRRRLFSKSALRMWIASGWPPGEQGGDSHPPPAKNRRQCQTQRETSHCPPYGPFNIHSPVSRRESTPCSRNSSSASATSRPSLVPRRSMICAKYLGPLSSACRAVW
jgi:hypothetical protein